MIYINRRDYRTELGGHGHELNGHRCPCPRHGHGRGMDTKFLEKTGSWKVLSWKV